MSSPDRLEFHEVSEADHRILNPLSEEKLALLGAICCAGQRPVRHVDLACGKGEMVCQWAATYGNSGLGVDTNASFVAAASQRAADLDVVSLVEFRQEDAASLNPPADQFEIVSCIGASWIGGGLAGTIDLMRRFLMPGGLLLVGEVFWHEVPVGDDLIGRAEDFSTLAGTVERCAGAGAEVIEMVLANQDDWDRYQASQWYGVRRWLLANPGHPQAQDFRAINDLWRRAYLDYGRRRWGWGVFVLRSA